MTDDRDGDHVPGARVRVQTRFGWALTGELRISESGTIRMFDSAIGDVVRLDHEDVLDIAALDNAPAEIPE